MAEEKKPPKLALKGSKNGTLTSASPSKSSNKLPPKKLPPKVPPQSASSPAPKQAPKQAPKLNRVTAQAKTKETSKQSPRANLTTAQTNSSAPKLDANKSAEAPRNSPVASKSTIAQIGSDIKKPSIAPKRSSASNTKQGTSDGKPTARKPSLAPRSLSTKQQLDDKRPSPPPKKGSIQGPKDGANEGPTIRRPSLAPKRSSVQKDPESRPRTAKQPRSDRVDETPAHRLNEENRDLKDILSESQCADLTILIANVTERMRQSIEKTFNAKAGLKLINQAKEGEDSFANIDYDPATVDVGAYDKERKVQAEQEKELSKPQVQQLRTASLNWFDEWRQVVIQRVGEVVNSKKTAEKQKDDVAAGQANDSPVEPQQRSQKISATGATGEYAPPKLDDLFPRVRTPLTKLPIAQRVLVLHSILLLLLSLEHYNAASRVLLLYLASSLKVGLSSLRQDEEQTAQGLLEAAKQMTAEQEAGKKKQESAESRKWKIRLASAAGAAIIGYTGGMAAPMVAAGVGSVMGELGLGSTAAAGYLGSVAGNTAIVGSLFGAYGGRMTGQIMSNISAEVEDFAFLPVHGERKDLGESLDAANDKRRLRVIVAISGWLLEKEEVVSPWRVLKPSAEIFALRFELEALMNLGQSFDTMLSSAAYGYAQSALAKRTVFSELMSAMWPIALVKVARVVDNPFSLAKNRADKAGEVLAEALMNRAQGERPVTLIGYSLGSRVVWSCLTTLARKRGFGFVESAVMMGSPIPSDVNTWREMRSAVTGRLINVYSENDYLLAFLYRSASLQYGVAGLMPVCGLSGIENVDVSEMVSGHLRYRYLVGSILDKIRFEDVDKHEVAKEAKAYEAMVEEEKKNTYEKQVRAGAGNLYDEYGQKLGLPKDGKKYVSQQETDVSDDQANQQASKMEKQIHDKTQKGLMQWAVEQLYITPASAPSTDNTSKAASDPKKAADKTGKNAEMTSEHTTKSLYERAMEATYLRRSGGAEGEAAAKDKVAKAQRTAKSPNQNSYLSSAANYIPSGYFPTFGGSDKKAPKKLGEQSKRPSTLGKTQSKSKGSVLQLKRIESTQKGSGVSGKATPSKDKTVGSSAPKTPDSAGKNAQMGSIADSKTNGKVPSDTSKQSKGFLESFSESRQKAANDAAKNPLDTEKKGWDTAKKGWNTLKEGKQEIDDFTKTAKDAKETAEGYGSYLPSFGRGISKEAPEGKSTAPGSTSRSSPTGGPENKQDSSDRRTQQNSPKEKPEESSGYTSYIPSFGFGGSSGEKPSEESKKDKPSGDSKNEGGSSERKADDKDVEEYKADEKSDEKNNSDKPQPKPDGSSNDEARIPDEPQAKDNPPKKRYPWEVAMDQGQDVDPKKAEASSKQESSSYNPTSYIPSFGWGGASNDKANQDQEKSEEAKGDDQKPAKSPKGGLMSDSDIYPEDSISSPEKARRRPRSKQPKEKKDTIPETGQGNETSEDNKNDAKNDGDGKKRSDDPSKDAEQEQPKKKYPWEIAMEEGRDVQAEQEAKKSGLSSYLPSFGGGGDGGWSGS